MRQINIRKSNLATNLIKPDFDPVTIITIISSAIPTIKVLIGFWNSLRIPHSIEVLNIKYSYTVMYDTKLEGFIAGYYSDDFAEWAAVTKEAYKSIPRANRAFANR